MNTQTYAQRQQIIENMARAAESNVTIHIEQMTGDGIRVMDVYQLLKIRKRTAQEYFKYGRDSGTDDFLVDYFIQINERIKLILGL